VDRRDAGLASGLINTTRQIGGSLGLAALLTIAASRTTSDFAQGHRVAETAGFTLAFEVAAALLVLAAVVAATVLPTARHAAAAGPVSPDGDVASEHESAQLVLEDA
jgi:hypothetical protein